MNAGDLTHHAPVTLAVRFPSARFETFKACNWLWGLAVATRALASDLSVSPAVTSAAKFEASNVTYSACVQLQFLRAAAGGHMSARKRLEPSLSRNDAWRNNRHLPPGWLTPIRGIVVFEFAIAPHGETISANVKFVCCLPSICCICGAAAMPKESWDVCVLSFLAAFYSASGWSMSVAMGPGCYSQARSAWRRQCSAITSPARSHGSSG